MIKVKIIDEKTKRDINIKNEPFRLYGRMLPSYVNETWDYTTELFPKEDIREMCFPDENYDYDGMAKEHIFVGAYDGETCVGLAILKHDWMKYIYLYDLKVNSEYRGKHIGQTLIEKCKEIAAENGYRGVYTIGQDNNLGACLFYVNNGFSIGGLDTRVYTGTSQEGKKDIIFYYDAEAADK